MYALLKYNPEDAVVERSMTTQKIKNVSFKYYKSSMGRYSRYSKRYNHQRQP